MRTAMKLKVVHNSPPPSAQAIRRLKYPWDDLVPDQSRFDVPQLLYRYGAVRGSFKYWVMQNPAERSHLRLRQSQMPNGDMRFWIVSDDPIV